MHSHGVSLIRLSLEFQHLFKPCVDSRTFSALSPRRGQPINNKAFSKTLLLPKTPFPLWTDPLKTDLAFQSKTCDRLYRWQVGLIFCHAMNARIDATCFLN